MSASYAVPRWLPATTTGAPFAAAGRQPLSTESVGLGGGRAIAWPGGADVPVLRVGDVVHMVGVAGAGMRGLAQVMAARGVLVSGCDRSATDRDRLEAAGVDVMAGHGDDHVVPSTKLLAVSAAIDAANPDVVAARRLGVPVVKRAALVGALMNAEPGVAVAGTHGKSTTTAMVGMLLEAAGMDPTVLVGADVPELGGYGRPGGGAMTVIEADEYDRSFLSGRPLVAVITNVEHDHPDIYPRLDDVVDAFRAFAALIRPEGTLIANAADGNLRRVALASPARVEWFAVAGDDVVVDDIDWSATDIQSSADAQSFEVWHRCASHGRFEIRLAGRHNVANALAAIAAASAMGAASEAMRSALAGFAGAGRRFETRGSVAGVTVIDDYAHHPTEVRATIAAARERFPGQRVWAVFEPHTYSRLNLLLDDFAAALATADRRVVAPVFGARETAAGDDPTERLATVAGAVHASDLSAAAELVASGTSSGDVVLVMGAGNAPQISSLALRALADRAATEVLARARAAGLGGDEAPRALSDHTTLRVGGEASLVIRCRSLDCLAGWWRLAREAQLPVVILGRGSNVLASDEGFAGLVLLNRCEGWEVDASGEQAFVIAEGGVTLAALGSALGRLGWSGLETAVGIPGSVGAAVVTNAGAHGWEMADSLLWAEIADQAGVHRMTPDELGFRYRGSALKGRHDVLVLRAAIALRADDVDAIAARAGEYQRHRKATQPNSPSVGSMFKNPPGDYAGRLLEEAGLKGLRVGGAQISEVHANFFINIGDATEADVRALVARARHAVRDKFGVDLELEIEAMGSGATDAP